MRRTIAYLALVFVTALVISLLAESQPSSVAGGTASDGPGDAASWTTGNKVAVGTSADTASKVWFTVAKGGHDRDLLSAPRRAQYARHAVHRY